ncbi:hypothetical protein GTS_01660 [Gandjariella thermophila]|uniref:Uncharacterized protein n=1 Tax=Gandjariella thermophila TaxID=1931992 RepID=A0A4D4J3H0_9PSEU|nr:hypothetical protein GTS_01660 [Gandjariella thermophila]
MLSASSAGPYIRDMLMQPRPRADTPGPVAPSRREGIDVDPWFDMPPVSWIG